MYFGLKDRGEKGQCLRWRTRTGPGPNPKVKGECMKPAGVKGKMGVRNPKLHSPVVSPKQPWCQLNIVSRIMYQ